MTTLRERDARTTGYLTAAGYQNGRIAIAKKWNNRWTDERLHLLHLCYVAGLSYTGMGLILETSTVGALVACNEKNHEWTGKRTYGTGKGEITEKQKNAAIAEIKKLTGRDVSNLDSDKSVFTYRAKVIEQKSAMKLTVVKALDPKADRAEIKTLREQRERDLENLKRVEKERAAK
jgi:hypothetical protein